MLKANEIKEKHKKEILSNIENIKESIKKSDSLIIMSDNMFITLGSSVELCALLATAIKTLKEQGINEELLKSITKTAFMNDEEINKVVKNIKTNSNVEEILEKISELLGELNE